MTKFFLSLLNHKMNKQRTILVTGASRGIGYDTVVALAQQPENHIIALSRNEKKLERTSF